jgi:osmoprotectant transport system permease protein
VSYLLHHFPTVLRYGRTHLYLALVPLLIGLAIAIPVGAGVHALPRVRRLLVALAGAAYTVPSLALFVVVPVIFGVAVIDPRNVVIALSIYSTALLVIAVPAALDSVPADVLDSAAAVGFGRLRRLLTVEMPLAVPVFVSNLRVVAVTNVSLVSVGAVIGQGALGQLFTQGYQRDYPSEIFAGVVAVLVLALVVDRLIYLVGRVATPWQRRSATRWPGTRAAA